MGEHPRTWIERETPCGENDQLAAAEVLPDGIDTATTIPRLALSPVGSSINLGESYHDSAGYIVDEATHYGRPTHATESRRNIWTNMCERRDEYSRIAWKRTSRVILHVYGQTD